MLTVDTIPLQRLPIANCDADCRSPKPNRQLAIGNVLFRLFVISVFAATATELTKLQPVGRGFLILSRNVVAALTLATLKDDVVSRHILFPGLCLWPLAVIRSFQRPKTKVQSPSYSTTSETVPAPTVRPPSRIANRSPFSIAIGAINSISIATLSPGITISTPSGRCATPVTSVVRK